ncbi:MAG: hypothetical protein AAGH15_05260 [Myxococcota bacterium]
MIAVGQLALCFMVAFAVAMLCVAWAVREHHSGHVRRLEAQAVLTEARELKTLERRMVAIEASEEVRNRKVQTEVNRLAGLRLGGRGR